MRIKLTINGLPREIDTAPDEKLLDVLRREGYLGVKFGCGRGECGTCTVILDGRAVKSCITFSRASRKTNPLASRVTFCT